MKRHFSQVQIKKIQINLNVYIYKWNIHYSRDVWNIWVLNFSQFFGISNRQFAWIRNFDLWIWIFAVSKPLSKSESWIIWTDSTDNTDVDGILILVTHCWRQNKDFIKIHPFQLIIFRDENHENKLVRYSPKKSKSHDTKIMKSSIQIWYDPVCPVESDYLNSWIIENSRCWNCEKELILE